MCGEYTDYTRSYHHPCAQFWVGSSHNWSVFLERPNTGRHEKASVHCPCSRLAALHGAPRTQDSRKMSLLYRNVFLRKLPCLTTYPKTVLGGRQGQATCKILSLQHSLHLCQLNYMKTIRLPQSLGESGQPQFWRYYRI